MEIKIFKYILMGKKNLTFWLIFLNCLHVIPVRVEIHHNLVKIEPNTFWHSENQSLKKIKEYITLYFFEKQTKAIQDFDKIFHEEKECKKKNDLLLSYFVDSKNQKYSQEEILKFQNYALELLHSCKENEYIEINAKNIIYWFSTYEVYHNNY